VRRRLLAELPRLALRATLVRSRGLRVDTGAKGLRQESRFRLRVVTPGHPDALAALAPRRPPVRRPQHQPLDRRVVGLHRLGDRGDVDVHEPIAQRQERGDRLGDGWFERQAVERPQLPGERFDRTGGRRRGRAPLPPHRRPDGPQVARDARVFFDDPRLHAGVFEELEQLASEAPVAERSEPALQFAFPVARGGPAGRGRRERGEVEVEGPELEVARPHRREHAEESEVPLVAEPVHVLGEVHVVAVAEGPALSGPHLHILAAVGPRVECEGPRDVGQRHAPPERFDGGA
jgi:hypothetical protein